MSGETPKEVYERTLREMDERNAPMLTPARSQGNNPWGICPQCGSNVNKIHMWQWIGECLTGHRFPMAEMISLVGVVENPPSFDWIHPCDTRTGFMQALNPEGRLRTQWVAMLDKHMQALDNPGK